jgi:hypothetical protein
MHPPNTSGGGVPRGWKSFLTPIPLEGFRRKNYGAETHTLRQIGNG